MSGIRRWEKRAEARKALKRLFDISDNVFIVHYSCEGFARRENGRSLRIASIAVKHLKSGTVRSFSIHQHAEQLKIGLPEIWEAYERIEQAMLATYFHFVQQHLGYTWAHWNMRSDNYGFQALEHRFRVLGGDPAIIEDSRKVDIAQLMKDIYGPDYAPTPVLVNIAERNKIESSRFMPGSEEAAAFERGEFLRLHQSTHKKVDFISYIAELALDGRLKTFRSLRQVFGWNVAVMIEAVRENTYFKAAGIITGLFAIAKFIHWIATYFGWIAK